MADLQNYPGLLYVAATLLPLVSFVILLLAGMVRTALRAAQKPEHAYDESPEPQRPSRLGGYVATAAIAGSFVLSLVGFVNFSLHYSDHVARVEKIDQDIHELHEDVKKKPDQARQLHGKIEKLELERNTEENLRAARWTGRLNWAGVEKQNNEKQPGSLLQVGYRIDHLAAIMFLMVTFIATLIHLFSIGYMSDELQPVVADHEVNTAHGHLHRRGRFGRFFLYMSLFCFSMLNLVLADNLFQVFVSWELVGICSYLLIGHYYERTSASNASNKAFITNRVGDAGFIVGLLIVWTYIGTFNFEEIFARIRAPQADFHGDKLQLAVKVMRGHITQSTPEGHLLEIAQDDGATVLLFPRDLRKAHLHAEDLTSFAQEEGGTKQRRVLEKIKDSPSAGEFGVMPYWLLVAAGLGIFFGCVGKSAQFPLQVWLPDAMEGPTPVSALIHAATMVAAGVYLVGRCFPIFTMEALLVIAYTGAITLFVAASIAIVMTDIKKVLAYSTVSQLGYMMLALGIGGWVAGLFHLITHAFFKALLFLGSGSVIYGCHHQQDMLKMGGLYPKMKITALTMLMGVLAIAGTPFFSGWYSKDAIVAQALGFGLVYREHFLLFLLPLITAGITTFYMFRMWFMTFTGEPRDEHVHEHAGESPWVMTVPLIALAFFSVTVGWGFVVRDPDENWLNQLWGPESSWLARQMEQAQPKSVEADFGAAHHDGHHHGDEHKHEDKAKAHADTAQKTVADRVHENHALAGYLALGVVISGFAFAALVYYYRVLDPAEAKEQFPGVHRFLTHKWYFDELYSALLVRPALAVAGWCRWFDTRVIDGVVDNSARVTVNVSKGSGWVDLRWVDGLANLTARVFYGVGSWLRNVQTGYIRSYVLFLVVAAIGIWLIVSVVISH